MYIIEVLVQHSISSLNRPFSYLHEGEIQVGVRVFINFNRQQVVGYVTKVEPTTKSKSELEQELGYELRFVDDVIDQAPILNDELVELADNVASYYFAPMISVLHAMLPPSLRPARSSLKEAKIAYESFILPQENTRFDGLTKRQQEVLEIIKSKGRVKKTELPPGILSKLISYGLVKEQKQQKMRLKLPEFSNEKAPTLTDDQMNAVNAIYFGTKQTYLLEGVTGSGKTEVYLSLAEKMLDAGKNVLILVPEIALTPMMVKYFLTRFDTKVALFHSELTAAEKYDEYRRIASGEVRVVIGARSAIFVPLNNIGLIVIDEEHSSTYKQEDVPFYHALTIAEMRAKTFNSKIVLGSATPSLETRSRALKGVYGHVILNQRINRQPMPHTQIVDMLNFKNVSKQSAYFSNALLEAIGDILTKKEQAILLVNRRGYAGYINCRNCGYVAHCPECGLTLTFHRENLLLRCHHCGHQKPMIHECPECHDTHLKMNGFGTERAVEQLQKIYPQARILRLDSDVAKERTRMTKTLGQFANHEADILVGTQMIAKGHDFPKVTLVGVVNADAGLAIPSYRSSESTFQLIMQAVGRSGRAELSGRAIIQTTLPLHYAIVDASRQDYPKFYQTEMQYRKLGKNPPFTYLLQISLSSSDEDKLDDTVVTLKETIQRTLGDDVTVIGPSIPLYQIIKTIHERKLIVKYTNYFRIKPKLLTILRPINENSLFKAKINIDPFDI